MTKLKILADSKNRWLKLQFWLHNNFCSIVQVHMIFWDPIRQHLGILSEELIDDSNDNDYSIFISHVFWTLILSSFYFIIRSFFSVGNLPRYIEFWRNILDMSMLPNSSKRKGWKLLEGAWPGKTSKKKFTFWPKWNTPTSSICIKFTKMGKMSYLSLNCKRIIYFSSSEQS